MINNINIYHFKILQNIKEKANIFIKNIKILVKNVNQTKEWHFLKTWQTLQKRGMGSKNVAFATETLLCGNPTYPLLFIFAQNHKIYIYLVPTLWKKI